MRITKLYIKEYKNLKDFYWEINPDYPIAVIVGKNASGKTNLVEAIVNIFQQVLLRRKYNTDFEFELTYKYDYDGDILVEIQNIDKHLIVKRNGEKIALTNINSPIQPRGNVKILPENILLYYAGISNRFSESLKGLNSQYYFGIRDGKTTSGRSVMSYEPIHYKAVMFALLLSSLKDINEFLAQDFGITGLHELKILIGKPQRNSKGNEDNYWEAPAIIKSWIDQLRKHASGQELEERCKGEKQWNFSFSAENFGQDAIRDFDDYEFGLFQILDSLSVMNYLKGIEIYFKKEGITQPIEFNQLSDGEKQRLAIRGAVEIFRGKETLFLLDRPDVFAHPQWQWEFVPDLQRAIGDHTFSQVIFVTHSALVLSTAKENTFFMDKGKIESISEVYGMDVNSVLINAMDSDKRTKQVEIDFETYFSLIESGKGESEEAKSMRIKLEEIYSLNHPALSKADLLIPLYL